MRILVDFILQAYKKAILLYGRAGWSKENKLKEAVDSRDVALILCFYIKNKGDINFYNLREVDFQYLCEALLKKNKLKCFYDIIHYGFQFFPNSLPLLNLQSLALKREGKYDESIKSVEKIIHIKKARGEDVSKYVCRLDDIKSKVKAECCCEVVYCNKNYLIKHISHVDSSSDILFVTFWGGGHDPDPSLPLKSYMLNRKGYAEKFVIGSGYDLLAVNVGNYNFYQDFGKSEFDSATQHILGKYKHVYMYGGSGGGYAALYYSIGNNAIPIVFSPRIRIDPSTGLSTSNNNVNFKHKFLNELISEKKAFVFYDPHTIPDRKFVEHRVVPAFPNAELITLPFSGHGAFFLSEIKAIKEIVIRIISAGGFNQSDYYNLFSHRRRESLIYHYHMVSKLISSNKTNSALVVACRALAMEKDREIRYGKKDIYKIMLKQLEKEGDCLGVKRLSNLFKVGQ